MTLRLIQVSLGTDERASVEDIFESGGSLGCWSHELHEGSALVSAVIESQQSEVLIDQLAQRFEGRPDFRMVVLPVEATLPRPPEGDAAATTLPKSSPDRVSRAELLEDLKDGLEPGPRYYVTVFLSSIVAAVGLLRDDVAILIGAMVIAPLLTPNVALTLGTTLGDAGMIRRALRTNVAGIAAAFMFSCLLGLVTDVDASAAAIATRSVVSYGDIVLALAAGAAGALAFTTGIPAALVGVMVAVALLPPTVVTGLLAGSGRWEAAFGSWLLLATNVICINLSGVITFWFQGLKPRSWWDAEKAKRSMRLAMMLWGGLLMLLTALVWLSNRVQ